MLLAALVAVLPAAWGETSGESVDRLEPAKAAIRVKDYAQASAVLAALAAQGDADAQYLLGTLHLAGLTTGADPAPVRALFEAAANEGHARAAYGLAALLANDAPADTAGARRWLETAAALGDEESRQLLDRNALPLEFKPGEVLTDPASRQAALWRAAARDDRDTVDALAGPPLLDAGDAFGRTALHHAADAGALSAMESLLARGAAVDVADMYGVTPLMLACATESPRPCVRLLAARPDVSRVDDAGHSAVDYAVGRGRAEQERALLAAGASPATRRALQSAAAAPTDRLPRAVVDAYAGWPDVVVAASRNDPAALRDLLNRGADPNARTAAGESALYVAVAAGASKCAIALLEAGADASVAGPDGSTPLGMAVRRGQSSMVEVLLAHAAAPPAGGARDPSLLVTAVGAGDSRLAGLLLDARSDPDSRDADGTPVLVLAASRNHAAIAKRLLDAGADPSLADAAGRTALWHAACGGLDDLAAALAQKGAGIGAADRNGVTALACAAARGHAQVVDRLLRSGAEAAPRTRSGDTPLMLAAATGQAAVVRRLLAAGAALDAQNQHGDTALILASQSGHGEIVQALLAAGASRQLRNRDGAAARDAARARRFDTVAAMLQ